MIFIVIVLLENMFQLDSMNKNNKKLNDCEHSIGYKAMGGFPGHEHIHTTGEQCCLNCEKNLQEIYSDIRKETIEWFLLEITKMTLDSRKPWNINEVSPLIIQKIHKKWGINL